MARIKLTVGEFGDYVAAFLYDKMTNPEEIVPAESNVMFNDAAEIMSKRGLRNIFLSYWLQMDPQQRVKYRMTRSVFNPFKPASSVILEIVWEPAPVEKKPTTIIGKLMKKFIKGEFDEKEKK